MFPFNIVHVFLFTFKSHKFVLYPEHCVQETVGTEEKFFVWFYLISPKHSNLFLLLAVRWWPVH